MKYIITGGHITPAEALIQFSQLKDDEIGLVSASNHPSFAFESDISQKYQVQQFTILIYKLHRHQIIKSIFQLHHFIRSFLQSYQLLTSFQPQFVVSFGGPVALPVASAALIKNIPIITHEQTTQAGLANRIIATFAAKVAISHPSSQSYFSSGKTVLTGNLVRQEFYTPQPPPSWVSSLKKPFIYITGGSQGSLIINQTIHAILNQLLENMSVLHQIGNAKISPPKRSKNMYLQHTWLDARAHAWALQQAAIVISRAGANTVAELEITHTPAILIPLKYAQKNEQYHNAMHLSKHVPVIIIKQDELDPQKIMESIHTLRKVSPKHVRTQPKPPSSVSQFYQLMTQLVE